MCIRDRSYLLPGLSFRRRKSSVSNATSSPSSSVATSPSSEFSVPDLSPSSNSVPAAVSTYLAGNAAHMGCARCHADLAFTSQIVSKGFTGRHGRAYLVAPVAQDSQYSSASALLLSPTVVANNPSLLPDLPNTHTHKAVPRHLSLIHI